MCSLQGTAHKLPLAAVALLMGGITLAGLPLAAGFPVRWLILRDLASVDYQWVWVVALAGLGVASVYLRAVYAMLNPAAESRDTSRSRPVWAPMILMMLMTLVTIALGLFPGPLLRVAAHLVTLYPLPHL